MKISLRKHADAKRICIDIQDRSYDAGLFIQKLASSSHPYGRLIEKYRHFEFEPGNFLSDPDAWQLLRRVHDLLKACLRNADPLLIEDCLVPADAGYLPPIPRAPLMFGLAGNCPQTWRHTATLIQNYPVGYVRPWRSLSGHNQRVTLNESVTSFRCAAELGVVIGKKAFRIPPSQASEVIVGYTCVNDMIGNQWKSFAENSSPLKNPTFTELLITSYYGRGTDGFAPVGPCIASLDEVGDPYNLLMLTGQNGRRRDRAYTNAMVVGIETTIAYLSRFMTLYPGTIIHMGTMGVDGITLPADRRIDEDDFVEIEIENIGVLKTYFEDQRKIA